MIHAKPTYDELERLYFQECTAHADALQRLQEHGDAALKARIAELEQQLATVNARLIAAQGGTGYLVKGPYEFDFKGPVKNG